VLKIAAQYELDGKKRGKYMVLLMLFYRNMSRFRVMIEGVRIETTLLGNAFQQWTVLSFRIHIVAG
jgi:hypothetical protein